MKNVLYSIYDITNINNDTDLKFIFSSSDLMEIYNKTISYVDGNSSIHSYEDVERYFSKKIVASFIINGKQTICKITKMVY